MRDELKTALDKVTADEALRQSTRAFLARQTGDYGAAKARPRVRRMAAAFACLALVIAGGTGYWPTSPPPARSAWTSIPRSSWQSTGSTR